MQLSMLLPSLRQLRAAALTILFVAGGPAGAQEPVDTHPVVGLSQHVPQQWVLDCGTLIIGPGKTLSDATIVIDGAVIQAVGTDVDVPPTARRIDLSEATVYAGFIDGYGEMELPSVESGAKHWNKWVTPQRSVADHYAFNSKANATRRKQGITARLVAPNDGLIKGTSALVSTLDSNSEIIQSDVGQHVALTPRGQSRSGYPSSPMGAVALVRQTLLDADWYRQSWQAFRSGSTADHPVPNDALDAIQAELVDGQRWIIDAADERYFMRAHRIADEFSLKTMIVRGSGREYRRIQDIAETGHAVLVPIDYPKAPSVNLPADAMSATLERLMAWDLAPSNPAKLEQANVTFAITTDRLEDVSDFLPHIRKAVQRGLTPDAALAAITTNPAKMFGVENELGQIAPGMRANLVVADGDLFTEKSTIAETWVNGERFEFDTQTLPDPRGQWSVVMRTADGQQIAGKLSIKGTRNRLKGKLIVSNNKFDLQHIDWQNYHFSFVVDAQPLNQTGVVRISLVVPSDNLTVDACVGTGLLPDGSQITATAHLVQPREKDDDKTDGDESGGDESDGDESDGDESDDDESDDDESGEDGPDDDEPDDDESDDDESDDDESDDESDDDESDDDESDDDESDDDESDDDESDDDESDDDETDGDETTGHGVAPLYEANFPLGAYGRDELPEQHAAVVMTHATVWTCAGDGILQDASVLIENGKITAVGTNIDVPPNALSIDCRGKHITPGIIDCHSHIATDGGINEGTQVITAEVRIGDFIDADDISIYRQLAGGVTTANILHGSANPIGGQNQVIKMKWGASPAQLKFKEAPAGIKFALGENVKQSNWANSNGRYPQTRMGVDEIINDAFERAKTYAREKSQWQSDQSTPPPRVDLEMEALVEILNGQRWIHCHSYKQSEISALIRTCERHGVTIGTFQHVSEGYKVADQIAQHGGMGSAFADWWAYKFEVYDAIPYNGALMHQAGVTVSFNSDNAEMGRRLNLEAAKAVKYGNVSPEDALKFVTLNPAIQLRIDQYVGSLQPGKSADLVVWSTQPLSSYAKCEQTWIDGRRYFDLQEDLEFRERDATRHAALVQQVIASSAEQLKPGERDRSQLQLWPRHDIYCHHHHGHDHEH